MNLEQHYNHEKKKALRWLGAFLLLSMCTYYFGVGKTISLFAQKGDLDQQTSTFTSWMESQSTRINSAQLKLDAGQVQHNLFTEIATWANSNNLKIEDMGMPHVYTQSGLAVNTYTVVLSGAFKPQLQLINTLEREFSGGRVSGFRFEKIKDPQNRKERLILTLLIQSLGEEKSRVDK